MGWIGEAGQQSNCEELMDVAYGRESGWDGLGFSTHKVSFVCLKFLYVIFRLSCGSLSFNKLNFIYIHTYIYIYIIEGPMLNLLNLSYQNQTYFMSQIPKVQFTFYLFLFFP